jgi:steroid-24-oyl-CoA synthetase
MALSYADAVARVTAPGGRFEVAPVSIGGVAYRAFVRAPRSLREVFDSARQRGEDVFLVYENERWTFAAVMAEVDGLAAALVGRYGIGPGDRVALAMRNYPEWVVTFAAVLSIGAVVVPLNAWWAEEELDYGLTDSGASVLVADGERALLGGPACARLGIPIVVVRDPALEGVDHWGDVIVRGASMPSVDVEPEMDATILYTSGTTGRPKGAVSTHRAIVQALMGFGCRAAVEALRTGPTDGPAAPAPPTEAPPTGSEGGRPVFILIVPLFHVTGCVPVMLSCFSSGLKLVVMYKWDPERALELIERERVTNFVGVPTQSWDLLDRHASPSSTPRVWSASAAGARRPHPNWCGESRRASPKDVRPSAMG